MDASSPSALASLALQAPQRTGHQGSSSSGASTGSHAHGSSFRCRLRVYVYQGLLAHLRQQQRSGRFFGFPTTINSPRVNVSCLEAPCSFDTFEWNNIRQYTSEVPIYERLVTMCPVVSDAEQADVFLVPFYYGYMMTLGWQVKHSSTPPAWRAEHRQMIKAALSTNDALPYLNNRTASRHIFLFSCDSQFVNIDLHENLRTSLVVHLGDDAFHGSPALINVQLRNLHHMPEGLIVPYRVSQWMPFGFNRSSFVGPRPLLLSMNVNMERHSVRRKVAAAIREAASSLNVSTDDAGGRLLLTSKMQGPYKAAQVALSSTFCLCPTGDSKGFTARFYFSLLHGCLPIRVDGYRRNATIAAPTYPFPQLIDWSRLIIDMRPDEAPMLLPRLFAMSEREIEKRQSYLQHVAHWLLFDNEEHAHHDASAAVIHTIQSRVFGRRNATQARSSYLVKTPDVPT